MPAYCVGFLNDGTKQWHQAGVQVVRLFYFMFSLLVYFVFLRYFSESDAGELPKAKQSGTKREEKQPSNNEAFPPFLLGERQYYVIELSMHAVTNGLSIYRDEMSEKSWGLSRFFFLLLNK